MVGAFDRAKSRAEICFCNRSRKTLTRQIAQQKIRLCHRVAFRVRVFRLRLQKQISAVAVDKSTYGKMQKVTLSAGALLERDREGVFRYSTGAGPSLCLVPDNVKFDHNAYYSLSDVADQAKLTGTPLTPGIAATGLPPLKKGVKLFFVAAPDAELAEFLRGQRAADASGWLNFLSRYPASPHEIGRAH